MQTIYEFTAMHSFIIEKAVVFPDPAGPVRSVMLVVKSKLSTYEV